MGKKILAFELAEEKRVKFEKLCNELEINVIYISSEYYEQKLGALAAIKGFRMTKIRSREKPFNIEMIVLSGLNSDDVDTFLKEYKKSGLEPIPLRAMLTPHNIHWTPKKLHKELMIEHLMYTNPRK